MKARARKWTWRACGVLISIFILFVIIGQTCFLYISEFKPQIINFMSGYTHTKISFKSIKAKWYHGDPKVMVEDLVVTGSGIESFTADNFDFRLDLLRTIRSGHLHLKRVMIKGAKLKHKQAVNTFKFSGQLRRLNFEPFMAEFKDFIIDYSPRWPAAEKLQGVLTLDPALKFVATSGEVSNAKITNLLVKSVPKTHQLIVRSNLSTTLENTIGVLLDSPVKNSFESFAAGVDLQGPANIKLNFDFPLDKTPCSPKMSGEVSFINSKAKTKTWHLGLENINGKLIFNDEELTTKNLKALLGGQSVKLSLNKVKNSKMNEFIFNLSGYGHLNHLVFPFANKTKARVNGKFYYRAMMHILPDISENNIDFISDLNGVDISGIPSAEKKASAIEQASLHVRLKRNKINKLEAGLEGGVYVDWERGSDLSKAKNLLNPIIGKKDHEFLGMSLSELVSGIKKLHYKARQFNFAGSKFDNLEVEVKNHPTGWNLKIDSNQLKGDANYSEQLKIPFQVHLQRIDLQDGKFALDPRKLPNTKLEIDRLQYLGHTFNAIGMTLLHSHKGVSLENMHFDQVGGRVKGSGYWSRGENNKEESKFDVDVDCDDFGKLLHSWHLTQSIKGGKGNAHLQANWAGAPFDFNLDIVNADIDLSLKDGDIVDVGNMKHEINLGRVLTLFNFQSWARRLRFDFRDITQSGVPFDLIEGGLKFHNSELDVDHFALRGPVLDLDGSGNLFLRKKEYDINLTVMPKIGGNLPLLAAMAWNPIVGAVTLAASYLLADDISHMAAWHYRLQGSWHKPVLNKAKS